jgi:hypothetical protein
MAAEEPRPVLCASRRVVPKWRKRGRGGFSVGMVMGSVVGAGSEALCCSDVVGGRGSPAEELEEGRSVAWGPLGLE